VRNVFHVKPNEALGKGNIMSLKILTPVAKKKKVVPPKPVAKKKAKKVVHRPIGG
jgi:hypothetical protein